MKPARDTVSRRIGVVAVSVLATVLVIGTAVSMALLSAAHKVDRLTVGYAPASDANSAALTAMLDAEAGVRGYALTGRTGVLRPLRRAMATVLPAIDAAGVALHNVGDRSLDRALAAERRLAQRWISTVGGPAARTVGAARRADTPAAGARFTAFRRANGAVAAALGKTRHALRADTENLSRVVLPLVIVVVVLVVLGSGYAVLRTARGVSRPLRALSDVVRRLQGGDLSARTDERAGPVEVRTVSAAVNSLALERVGAQDRQRADDALRTEVRELTSAIRIGQDAQTMVTTLVAGLGRVFGVDLVWLVTFPDTRIPRLGARWRQPTGSADEVPDTLESGSPDDGGDDLMLHALANRLWHGATVVGVDDHRAAPVDPAEPRIAVPGQAAGARASMIAAIGEGNSAMGLLWLATTDRPRTWTTVERGLVQHVAGELAQNLVQSHVLSQQRAAMRRLREADEAKTALVSTVSHELRTPLTSIIGYLDVLLDSYAEDIDAEVVAMLRVVERNATRLRSMIEDLLRQSQQEAGRRVGALDRIDLAHVLEDVRETIAPLAANARLELDTRPPHLGTVIVDGDYRELTQALVNLAANAVKFTPAGGRVTVSAARDGDRAEVRITDTGMGIPDDEIPHLFERFFRARNARSAVIPGTGLGLAIVSDIVTRHKGTIDVRSTLGVGTSFAIHIPLTVD